ncbi:hypothetical protein, partial [Alistipes putredinis]|uniref:hypothetical protein n=1 Tax=Alistipes putredinis TaxID=28117 RepID=UPI003AF6ED07
KRSASISGTISLLAIRVGHNLLLITPKHQNYIDPESSNFGNDISSEFGENLFLCLLDAVSIRESCKETKYF